MKNLVIVALALFVVGMVAGSSLNRGATAQDTTDQRVKFLEDEVAGLQASANYLYSVALPGPDPNGTWLGNAYSYNLAYRFGLLCTINQLAGVIEYSLDCTQPAPR